MQRKYQRSFNQIRKIVEDTAGFFSDHEIDDSLRMKVDLSLEELFVNMVNYNTETDEDILIEMSPRERGVEVSLTDFDVERFDPREVQPVDVDSPLDDRAPGGLGLYLVLKMVDSIHYEYRNRQSKITIIVDRT